MYQDPTSTPPDRQMFLATWKDIPNENEAQFQIRDCPLNAGRTPEPRPHSMLPLACAPGLPISDWGPFDPQRP